MIDQGEPIKLERIYLQNRTDGRDDERLTFGNLHICIGNNPASPTALGNTCSIEPIYEGGFIILNLPPGRYVFFDRRDKDGVEANYSVARAF